MATKSNQTDNQDFLRFPMSLSRDWSLSKEWPLSKEWSLSTLSKEWSLSMLDTSLISKEDWLASQEWKSKQSTVDFVANEWCSDNPGSNFKAATFGRFAQSRNEQEGQESTTVNKTKSKKGGTTDWLAMYNNALTSTSASVPITSVPAPVDTPSPQSPKPRRPRKVIPKEKVYVDQYTDFDVIFGRGGRSNHHPGNKMYRVQVAEKQSIYRSCESKREKTVIAQLVVDHVNKNQQGRFLELDTTCNRWYLVPNNVARTKVGQALRDNNTKEARAAKRKKYGC
jgi:hypothetical protein